MASGNFELKARSSSRAYQASLAQITDDHLATHQATWRPLLNQYKKNADGDWDWSKLIAEGQSEATHGCFSVAVEARGQLEGLMIAWASNEYQSDLTDDPLLYVGYVAAAPWNRAHFQRKRFKKRRIPSALSGVGEALVLAAVGYSMHLGFQGRLGLFAIDGAVDFYTRNCHFVFVGKHATRRHASEHWCELTAEAAAFLDKRRRSVRGPGQG